MSKKGNKHPKAAPQKKNTNHTENNLHIRKVIGYALLALSTIPFGFYAFYPHNVSVWIALSGASLVLTGISLLAYNRIPSKALFPTMFCITVIVFCIAYSLQMQEQKKEPRHYV